LFRNSVELNRIELNKKLDRPVSRSGRCGEVSLVPDGELK